MVLLSRSELPLEQQLSLVASIGDAAGTEAKLPKSAKRLLDIHMILTELYVSKSQTESQTEAESKENKNTNK